MVMISKLNPKAYPMDDPNKYLSFQTHADPSIDYIFKGRLAAFARDYGKGQKLVINSAHRSFDAQVKLFLAQGGKYSTTLGYYWPSSVPANKRTVAKPGSSFHNYRLAIDTISQWAKDIDKDAATSMQKILLKYGLFKPMTKGNGMSVLEDWHIQPIETLNLALSQRQELMPIDPSIKPQIVLRKGMKGDEVAILQYHLCKHGINVAIDFDFGPSTELAVKRYQKQNILVSDGIVGPATWASLMP